MRILVSEKLSPHKMKTPEGYLICTGAILSRTGKQTYRRSEIWGDTCDNAEQEVDVDRRAEEVFNDKTLASFENKPICIEHPDEDVNVNNHNSLSVGFVRDIKRGKVDGQDVMLGTLVITDADAVEAIERGDYTELSCGYNCDVVDEDNPQQRNIRGNHVALCEHGRAGIARIVDSAIEDADYSVFKWLKANGYKSRDLSKLGVFNRLVSDIIDKTDLSEQKAKELVWDYIDDINDNISDMPLGSPIKTESRKIYIFNNTAKLDDLKREISKLSNRNLSSTDKSAIQDRIRRIVEELRADYAADVADVKAGKVDCTVEAVKTHYKKADIEIAKTNFGLRKITDSIGDEDMKDADFSKQTKQGYQVLEMYRDGGRLHVIFKRANDYGIGLGYDTTDGQWAQGMYDYTTLEKARAALAAEKPYARRIADAIEDSVKDEWVSGRWLSFNHEPSISEIEKAYYNQYNQRVHVKLHRKEDEHNYINKESVDIYRLDDGTLFRVVVPLRDSVKDSLKTYEVSYIKDGVTHICKVKATSFVEAVKKAKED